MNKTINKTINKAINKAILISSLASVALLGGLPSSTQAEMSHADMPSPPATEARQPEQFQAIPQPLWLKLAVTAGGAGLIGLELWWFLFSKPKARTAIADGTAGNDVQEVTVVVDGGYEPSQIVVEAGHPVRLNFYRKDPSSCLEEVRLPDFRIAQTLPVNQTTAIEFTPEAPGQYEFTCGMNMFRGVVEVQPAAKTTTLQEAIAP